MRPMSRSVSRSSRHASSSLASASAATTEVPNALAQLATERPRPFDEKPCFVCAAVLHMRIIPKSRRPGACAAKEACADWKFKKGSLQSRTAVEMGGMNTTCKLSERRVRSGSKPQDVPDFTCGGLKTAKPLVIEGADLPKLNFDRGRIDNGAGQMRIRARRGESPYIWNRSSPSRRLAVF